MATNNQLNTGSSPLNVANGGTGAATLTANNVLLGNTTSAVQFVAPGSSGNLLTSNGTTWQSTAAAAGSELILISSATASSSATIDFTSISASSYSQFLITLINVLPASGDTDLLLRFSVAAAFQTSGYYSGGFSQSSSSATVVGSNASNVALRLNTISGTLGATAGRGFSGDVFIRGGGAALPTGAWHSGRWKSDGGGSPLNYIGWGAGVYDASSTVDGFRFLMTTGNIASGSIYLYGIKNT